MKIAIVTESPVDEAAVKIFVDAIVGSESELATLRARPGGWANIFDALPRIVPILHYNQPEVEALVIVMDSDESTPHLAAHDEPQSDGGDCRLCRARSDLRIALERAHSVPYRRTELKTAIGL